jgi:formamidopyrimidine-DNA glycosylase
MPELPEVETMVRGIRPFVEGRRIDRLERCRCPYRPIRLAPRFDLMARRCRGRTVVAVERRAKRAILLLDSGDAFVVEPRMTGILLVQAPPDTAHLRLVWHLGGAMPVRLLFWDRRGLGTVRLLNRLECERLLRGDQLGPEPLELAPAGWRSALARTSRPVKVALLDQKLVAGIGNLYASEILHRAGILPTRSASGLRTGEVVRLARAARQVLQEAIRQEGSTLPDGTYRNALNQPGSYQNVHQVYDRAQEPCPRCARGRIVRIVQAQRSTYYCPHCQK